jgi:predicted HTH transcriptional regulator
MAANNGVMKLFNLEEYMDEVHELIKCGDAVAYEVVQLINFSELDKEKNESKILRIIRGKKGWVSHSIVSCNSNMVASSYNRILSELLERKLIEKKIKNGRGYYRIKGEDNE